MADDLQTIVQRMIDAGESEDNIATVIQHFQSHTPSTPQTFPLDGRMPYKPENNRAVLAGAAPVVGGLLGGMVGGGVPGAIAGSAAGTAAGKAVQNRIVGRPMMQGTGQAAAEGAIGEGLGRGAAALMKPAAKFMYRLALRPTQAIRQGFPDVLDTAVRERALVTKGGEAAAEQAVAHSSAKAENILRDVVNPKPIAAHEMTQSLWNDVVPNADALARTGNTSALDSALARIDAVEQANKGGMGLLDANASKVAAARDAKAAYLAHERGIPSNVNAASESEAVAKDLRRAIEDRAPGVAAQNKETQSLIGLDRAIASSRNRSNLLPLLTGASGGRSPLGFISGMLAFPQVSSATGAGLSMAASHPQAVSQATKASLLALLLGNAQPEQ